MNFYPEDPSGSPYFEKDDLTDDPTLDACCERDLQLQKLSMQVRKKLNAADKSVQRKNMADSIILDHVPERASGEDALFEDEDDEAFDTDLQRLRQARMEELRRQSHSRAESKMPDSGTLQEVHEADIFRQSKRTAGPVVCHLTVTGLEVGQELDEHLTSLAHVYRGTSFWRAPLSRTSALPAQLSMPRGEGLLCLRDGVIVGKAMVQQFMDDSVMLEEEVTKWLRISGVLLKAALAGGATGEEQEASSCESEDDSGSEGGEPCKVCGRTYYHEHVKAVYRKDEQDSDADSLDGDNDFGRDDQAPGK